MSRDQAYTPAAPSRSHGEEIAAALLVVAIEAARSVPPPQIELDRSPQPCQPARDERH